MRAIENINLDELTAEQLDRIIGDYFDIPGHDKLYIEMTLLHWYWLKERQKRGETPEDYILDTLDFLEDEGAEYDPELFKKLFCDGLIAGGQGTLRAEQEGI